MCSYTPYTAPRMQEYLEATKGWTQEDFCAFMLHSWAMNYPANPSTIKRFKEKNYDRA